MPCCLEKGHQVKSKLGNNFFRHSRGSSCACASEETVDHYKLKIDIASKCRELGWNSWVEANRSSIFPGTNNEWRADVIAINDSKKVAFEIQYSPILVDDLYKRNERYLKDNVCCIWLLNAQIPLLNIDIDQEILPNISEQAEKDYHEYLENHFKITSVTLDFKTQNVRRAGIKANLDELIVEALSEQFWKKFEIKTGQKKDEVKLKKSNPTVSFKIKRNSGKICFNCKSNMNSVYGMDDRFWGYRCPNCGRIYNPRR